MNEGYFYSASCSNKAMYIALVLLFAPAGHQAVRQVHLHPRTDCIRSLTQQRVTLAFSYRSLDQGVESTQTTPDRLHVINRSEQSIAYCIRSKTVRRVAVAS